MTKKAYLAFDLGAESGRAMMGVLEGGKLALHELHRFANMPVMLPSGLHWNLLEWWNNLLAGLRKAMDYAAANSLEPGIPGAGLTGRSNRHTTTPNSSTSTPTRPRRHRAASPT